MEKDCNSCKHDSISIKKEPCKSCLDFSEPCKLWEPITGPTCKWGKDEDGLYHTECDNIFWLDSGTPAENGWVYCPYCGERLVSKEEVSQ